MDNNADIELKMERVTEMLGEGRISQAKYDSLVVQILSGEKVNEENDEEEVLYDYIDDEEDDDEREDDDLSACTRSSSLFRLHDDEDYFLEEEDEEVQQLGFSALYKQNSFTDMQDNPASMTAPQPPPPPTKKPVTVKNVMMGGSPKKTTKKPLTPPDDVENKERTSPPALLQRQHSSARSKRGFYRRASSLEAAKFNSSLAEAVKKQKFEYIMIDPKKYPPPQGEPPDMGEIPPPPDCASPKTLSPKNKSASPNWMEDTVAVGVAKNASPEVSPHVRSLQQSPEATERSSGEKLSLFKNANRPDMSVLKKAKANLTKFEKEPEDETNRSESSSLSNSESPDRERGSMSYKKKQFNMRPELLNAALKKRSQWNLNRQGSNEFFQG